MLLPHMLLQLVRTAIAWPVAFDAIRDRANMSSAVDVVDGAVMSIQVCGADEGSVASVLAGVTGLGYNGLMDDGRCGCSRRTGHWKKSATAVRQVIGSVGLVDFKSIASVCIHGREMRLWHRHS